LNIAVIDDVTLTAAQDERLQRCGDIRVFSRVPTERDEILRRAAGADIVIASWTKLPASVIQCLPDLKLLSIWATGLGRAAQPCSQSDGCEKYLRLA
jgi:phosphoglycerate dehydrogenase-like enzyme